MRKTSLNLIASASKTSLILSGCRHWLDPRASGDDGGSGSSRFGSEIHKSVEQFLLGEAVDNVEHIELYCIPARGLIESISAAEDARVELVEQALFTTLDGETSGMIDDYSELDSMDSPCFAGTADVILLSLDSDKSVVIDWKTGSGAFARNQLMSLGGLVASVCDSKTVRMISVELRPGEAKIALDFELPHSVLLSHLSNVTHKLSLGPTMPVVGAHCHEHFCPHRMSCKGIADEYYSAKKDHFISAHDDESLYRMYSATQTTLKDAEKAKERVLEEVRRRGGLRTPDGFFTETFRNVKRLRMDDVIGLAKSLGADDAAIEACKQENRESAGWRNRK